MKRLALLFFVLAQAAAAMAFDPTPPRGDRIGILNTVADEDDLETVRVASLLRGPLKKELRRAGYEAFDVRATFDEVIEQNLADADFYIEFMRGDAGDVYGIHSIFADMRLYDGRTLDLIEEIVVNSHRGREPVSFGVSTRIGPVWIGLPIALGSRGAVREAARDAALEIVEALGGEARGR
jgi:hypothetical protein